MVCNGRKGGFGGNLAHYIQGVYGQDKSGKVGILGYLVRKNDNFSKSQDFGDQSQEFATMLKLHVESHPET